LATQRLFLNLEIEMIRSPTTTTRRSLFRAGAGLAVAATATRLLTPASAQTEGARQAGAEALNGNGFYRFKIGDFQATVISDGYGQLPIGPILAMTAPEADLAAVLKANFMKPVMPDPFKRGTIGAARENLPPVANRSRFVKQGGEITSGVHYVAAPGHSPAHASILFASGNEQFMHMGDIAHNPVTSLQRPDWTPIFDYDPAQAIKSRKAILGRVATDRIMVMGYHFPFPAIGHVVRHDTAYRWEAGQWVWQ
jgi:hypothetical protein